MKSVNATIREMLDALPCHDSETPIIEMMELREALKRATPFLELPEDDIRHLVKLREAILPYLPAHGGEDSLLPWQKRIIEIWREATARST